VRFVGNWAKPPATPLSMVASNPPKERPSRWGAEASAATEAESRLRTCRRCLRIVFIQIHNRKIFIFYLCSKDAHVLLLASLSLSVCVCVCVCVGVCVSRSGRKMGGGLVLGFVLGLQYSDCHPPSPAHSPLSRTSPTVIGNFPLSLHFSSFYFSHFFLVLSFWLCQKYNNKGG